MAAMTGDVETSLVNRWVVAVVLMHVVIYGALRFSVVMHKIGIAMHIAASRVRQSGSFRMTSSITQPL
jgi:hypothetical protein